MFSKGAQDCNTNLPSCGASFFITLLLSTTICLLANSSLAQGDSALMQQNAPTALTVTEKPEDFLPKKTSQLASMLFFQGDLAGVGNIITEQVCTPGGVCLLGSGGGAGIALEWRGYSGLAFRAGYDAWFVDGNGVYELTGLQTLHGGARFYFLPEYAWHPYVGAALGLVGLGNSFLVDTLGGSIDFQMGFELEFNSQFSATLGLTSRFFSVAHFKADSDHYARATHFGLNNMLAFQIGFQLPIDNGFK